MRKQKKRRRPSAESGLKAPAPLLFSAGAVGLDGAKSTGGAGAVVGGVGGAGGSVGGGAVGVGGIVGGGELTVFMKKSCQPCSAA